jgi:hypothetical protein
MECNQNYDEITASIYSILYLLKKLDVKMIALQKLMKGEKPYVKYKKAILIDKSITIDFK